MKTALALIILSLNGVAVAQNRGVAPLIGAGQYYISPSGSDSNAGTAASPWASPNHSLLCGATIIAQAGTYSYANFASGKWGPVTCPVGNNIAWLKCATFDGCKISAGANFGMEVTSSWWGVQGFEVTTSSSGFSCFAAAPPSGATAGIHHIVFVNDICNGGGGGGFSTFHTGAYGVDYILIGGDIAYNSAQNSAECYSGISIYEPVESDLVADTHIIIAGNFTFANQSPSTCPYGAASSGIIPDTLDGSGTGGTGHNYIQKVLIRGNYAIGNGGSGIQAQSYTANLTPHATVYIQNNTLWGNESSTVSAVTQLCGEMLANNAYGLIATGNLIQTAFAAKCNSTNTMRALQGYNSDLTASGNYLYAASGVGTNTQYCSNSDSHTCSLTSGDIKTVSPAFNSYTVPGAPSCGSSTSVPNCMSGVVNNFTPTASGASAFGVQAVSISVISDSYFAHWVCGVTNIPGGLLTMGCA